VSAACALCGAGALDRRFEKEGVPYFRCRSCAFELAMPEPNPNLSNRLEDFEPVYLDYLSETAEDRRNLEAVHAWLEAVHPLRGARLLDLGAGSGKFVRFLRERGVDARGLEPSEALFAHFLRDSPAFDNETVESFAARSPGASFDVITALDVLEHVLAPRSFLEAASSLLRPGGLLAISTPDVASLPARLLGRRWHYYNRYHLSYFSRATLDRLARDCSLEPVSFSHRARYHSLGYALEYFLEFVLGGSRVRVPRAAYGWVLPMNLFDAMYACYRKS
jgi:2-polyprenyl-3-methyl-5-hydroxy-6-metoxy-1,4-benzoquinol methylase